MYDPIVSFLALSMSFIVGLMVGYSCGEDHATTVALNAKWEREAKEWYERHERLIAGSKQLEVLLSARDRIIGLQSENAKLRELCADLYAIRDRSGTYHVTALQVRLDELGIEVSE